MATKFYCAKYPAVLDQSKHNRDDALFAHLETAQKLTLRMGIYKFDPLNTGLPPKEKGVDVLLATDLLFDGMMNHFDCAYIISDDSDIIPAIEKLRTYSRSVKLYQATFEPKLEWQNVCTGVVQLFPNKIKKFLAKVSPTAATLSDLAAKWNSKK